MVFWQFFRNNTYLSIPGKLSEVHLPAWLFSNPCGKVLITVGISLSPDLRVQHMQEFSIEIISVISIFSQRYCIYVFFVCSWLSNFEGVTYFHQLGPLVRVGLVVAMCACLSVCLSVCRMSPFHVIFLRDRNGSEYASSVDWYDLDLDLNLK